MTSPASNGALLPKNTLSATDQTASIFVTPRLELAFLIAIGLVAVTLHASVHWPLKLPGHHGLEWMSLLLFARTVSTTRWAGATAAVSAAAASILPIWGFHETSIGLSYLLSGVIVDLLFWLLWPRHVLVSALVAALAHAAKPLWKWAAKVLWGFSFGSVAAGATTPLLTHLMFGFVGGLAGACAGLVLRRTLIHRQDQERRAQ